MPSLQDYIMNVAGGIDQARLDAESEAVAREQELGRQNLMQGFLSQIVGMQQNPFNVVSALQAQRSGGVAGAVAAGGGRRTTPFGDVAQQLIQNLASFSGAYQDPTTGISQNPLELERQRMIDQGLDPDTGGPLSEEKRRYYDNIAQFMGGQNLDANFSAERYQNLIGGGIGGEEARRQAGLGDEEFNAIWGPILQEQAGQEAYLEEVRGNMRGRQEAYLEEVRRNMRGRAGRGTAKGSASFGANLSGGSFIDPGNLSGGVIGPYQPPPTGSFPGGLPNRTSLSTLTPGLIRRGMV